MSFIDRRPEQLAAMDRDIHESAQLLSAVRDFVVSRRRHHHGCSRPSLKSYFATVLPVRQQLATEVAVAQAEVENLRKTWAIRRPAQGVLLS
jgi:hypothetical protein